MKFKGVSPERPLSNVYTSYRTVFTPLHRISLHQYDINWETIAQPQAVYISFIK